MPGLALPSIGVCILVTSCCEAQWIFVSARSELRANTVWVFTLPGTWETWYSMTNARHGAMSVGFFTRGQKNKTILLDASYCSTAHGFQPSTRAGLLIQCIIIFVELSKLTERLHTLQLKRATLTVQICERRSYPCMSSATFCQSSSK